MTEVRNNLGIARLFRVEAQGKPGKRTFRLIIEAEGGDASIWVKKEQLSALAMGVQGILEEVPSKKGAKKAPEGVRAIGRSFDIKAFSLGLVYRDESDDFGISAVDEDDTKAKRATLLWWVSRPVMRGFAEQALEVVAAGRPTCPLCHQPKDPAGHTCMMTNGHNRKLPEFQ